MGQGASWRVRVHWYAGYLPPGKGREGQRVWPWWTEGKQISMEGFFAKNLCIVKKIIAVVEGIFRGTKTHRRVQTHRASLGQPDHQVSRIYQPGVGGTAKQHKVHRGLLSVTGK